MVVAGIDLGTSAVKIAFINERNEIIRLKAFPAIPENIAKVNEIFDEELKSLSLSKDSLLGVSATGYGKRFFHNADKVVNEIIALAAGIYNSTNNNAKTVGGQDIKLVKISDTGKVIDFKMNDKCAAGTGRFFEMIAKILNISLDEFGDLGAKSQAPTKADCVCAVFAETEIASLLYKSVDKSDIVAGFHRAIARRMADFMHDGYLDDEIYFDGGLAQNKDLLFALQETLMRDVKTLIYPQFTSAIGAAMTLLYHHKHRINQ